MRRYGRILGTAAMLAVLPGIAPAFATPQPVASTTTSSTTAGSTTAGSTTAGSTTGGPAAVLPVVEATSSSPGTVPAADPGALSAGIRASRVMGRAVRNEAGDDIGTVNDLVISPQDNAPFAIIGVGGFLGVGERLIAIPVGVLEQREHGAGLILPGATRDSVKQLPEFRFPPRADRPAN